MVVVVSIGPRRRPNHSDRARDGADRGILVKAEACRTAGGGENSQSHVGRREARPGYSRQAGNRRPTTQPDRAGRVLGWSQRPLLRSSRLTVGLQGDREVDGALQTVKLKGPAIVTTRFAAERAALRKPAQHHEAKKKPIADKNADDYGADLTAISKSQDVRTPGPQEASRSKGRSRTGVEAQE